MSDTAEAAPGNNFPETQIGSIARGQSTLHLDQGAMFDRIINVKFFREDGESFIIRSDYEPVYLPGGTMYFKRCTQKPQVKVTYEQVPGAAINCNIEVTNLFIDPSQEGIIMAKSVPEQAEETYLEENGNPVRKAIIQLGYINQFPDWRDMAISGTPEKARQFFNLETGIQSASAEVNARKLLGNGFLQLTVMVLTVQQKSLPPDRITFFEGIVGNVEPGLIWEHRDDDLTVGYGEERKPLGGTQIEKDLFSMITRRYISPDLQFYKESSGDTAALYITAPFIRGDGVKLYENASLSAPVIINPGSDGLLSENDALDIGIQCWVSAGLKKSSVRIADTFLDNLPEAGFEEIIEAPFLQQQELVMGEITALLKAYPRARFYQMINYGYFFYDVEETVHDIFGDPFVKELQESHVITLPAVYDMTIDGMRIIRAPFHGFIQPLSAIRFNARYNIGTLVGFYYPKPLKAWLLMIMQEIVFSTTGNENMMTMQCVDIDPEDVPGYEYDQNTAQVKASADDSGQDRLSRIFVAHEVPGENSGNSRLSWIVERVMLPTTQAGGVAAKWAEAGKTPAIELGMKVLIQRNRKLLDTDARKKIGNSAEYYAFKNGLDALGVTWVPTLKEQDVIWAYLPWLPDDEGNEEPPEES
jgi:hypothetical protein